MNSHRSSEMSEFQLGPSLLFCPADRPERYDKAVDRSDAVILDLEDAVAPADKAAARKHVASYLDTSDRSERLVVRVNPVETSEFQRDVDMLAGTGVHTIMLAKTESTDHLDAVAAALPAVDVLALCETPAGITSAQDIAAHPATVALMWGAEDLVASMGGTTSRHPSGEYRDVARVSRSLVLLAAATHGKAGIDSIYADFSDLDGVREESRDAVASGWSAKACIHPSQVPVVRHAYTPSSEDVAYAQALLNEVPRHSGVFQFRGSMVDGPLIRHAEQTLHRAQAVNPELTKESSS